MPELRSILAGALRGRNVFFHTLLFCRQTRSGKGSPFVSSVTGEGPIPRVTRDKEVQCILLTFMF